MTSLAVRSTRPEELDEETTDMGAYRRCLAELEFINRITFTHRPTMRWLAGATASLPPGASFSVLDVGYGHGDLLRAIARWAERRGLKADLWGIDSNPRSAATASEATPAPLMIHYLTGDVLDPDFDLTADFVV